MSELIVSLNERKINLNFISDSKVMYNNKEFEFEIFEQQNSSCFLRIGEKFYNFTLSQKNNDFITLFSHNERFELTVLTLLQEKALELLSKSQAVQHQLDIKAPMPGMILKVMKNKGESVTQGESVMILEAMKMENEIRSSTNGVIKDILVRAGSAVEKGIILYTIEK